MAVKCYQFKQDTVSFVGELSRDSILVADKTLRQELAATTSSQISFDLAQVIGLDTAALAWLLELSCLCEGLHKKAAVHHAPESLIKLAKISDVEGLLSLQ